MAEIRVTPEMLKSKAEELRGLNASYKRALESLQSQEQTLNGQWDGQANDAFHRAFDRDVKRLELFYTAIEEYAQKLTQISQEYSGAELRNILIAGLGGFGGR